jgi:hypothetical protein
MKNPTPRIQMIEGFNKGWIEFEGGFESSIKGQTSLKTVLEDTAARNPLGRSRLSRIES